MKKGEIIRAGELLYSVYGVLGSVIYVKKVIDVKDSSVHELEEVLKKYRKIEIIGKEAMVI